MTTNAHASEQDATIERVGGTGAAAESTQGEGQPELGGEWPASDDTQPGLVVNIAFPFTLETPAFGPSRPFVGDRPAKAAYLDALERELASLDEETRARPVSAVRLSGGASIMNADKMCHLVRSVRKTLNLVRGAEVAIDVEPLTVCTPSLTDWTSCGITRVNLAAISVHDEELSAMKAGHTREQLQNAMLFLGKFHMPHVSVELMYGLPGQTKTSWERSLVTIAEMGYPHIRVVPLVDARAERADGAQAEAEARASADKDGAEAESGAQASAGVQAEEPIEAGAQAGAEANASGRAAGAKAAGTEASAETQVGSRPDAQTAGATDPTATADPDAAQLPGREERRAWYKLASEVLEAHGYVQYASGAFVHTTTPHARDPFDEAVRAGADVLGLGAGARSRIDGFVYENACDFDLYVQHSAEFETIVRNPMRLDEAALKAAHARPFSELTASERFEQVELAGATYAR